MTITESTTPQAIFDEVWNHFITNHNPPSMLDDGRCRYRLDGTAACPIRCAAGIFIADEDYTLDMEGLPIGDNQTLSNIPTADLLKELQSAHDNAARAGNMEVSVTVPADYSFTDDMKGNLLRIAQRLGLDIPKGELSL